MIRGRLALAFALGVASVARPASADPTSLAEGLFREAREQMRAGNYDVARSKLLESQKLDPSGGTLLNLGFCEEREERLASAWAHYLAVADLLPASDPRVRFATEHAAALASRVPRVRLHVVDGAAEDSVLLDGLPLGAASCDAALPLDPGTHSIERQAPDGAEAVTVFTIEEAEVTDVRVPTLPPRSVVPSSPGAPATAFTPPVLPSSGAPLPAGLALLAVGGVGIATSLALGAVVLEDKAAVSRGCVNAQCDAAGLAAGHQGSAFALASSLSFGVGAVALGAGTWLTFHVPAPAARSSAASVALGGTF